MKWMEDEAWHRSIITKAVHPWIHIRVNTLAEIRYFGHFLDNQLVIFFDNILSNFLDEARHRSIITEAVHTKYTVHNTTCRNLAPAATTNLTG